MPAGRAGRWTSLRSGVTRRNQLAPSTRATRPGRTPPGPGAAPRSAPPRARRAHGGDQGRHGSASSLGGAPQGRGGASGDETDARTPRPRNRWPMNETGPRDQPPNAIRVAAGPAPAGRSVAGFSAQEGRRHSWQGNSMRLSHAAHSFRPLGCRMPFRGQGSLRHDAGHAHPHPRCRPGVVARPPGSAGTRLRDAVLRGEDAGECRQGPFRHAATCGGERAALRRLVCRGVHASGVAGHPALSALRDGARPTRATRRSAAGQRLACRQPRDGGGERPRFRGRRCRGTQGQGTEPGAAAARPHARGGGVSAQPS